MNQTRAVSLCRSAANPTIRISKAMKAIRSRALILLLACSLWLGQVEVGFAQDKGAPAMQTIAFFSLGGGAAGAFLGLGYYLLDPLGPGSDLVNSALQGLAVGALAGTLLGIMQLQRQMVLPYQGPQGLPPANEFMGNTQRWELERFHRSQVQTASRPVPQLKLVEYQLRF